MPLHAIQDDCDSQARKVDQQLLTEAEKFSMLEPQTDVDTPELMESRFLSNSKIHTTPSDWQVTHPNLSIRSMRTNGQGRTLSQNQNHEAPICFDTSF